MTMASPSYTVTNKSNNNNNSTNNPNNNNKVNNSYESEPSTSSESCSSAYREQCPFNVADIDKLSLSRLLKPLSPSHAENADNADILTTTINKEFFKDESMNEFKGFNNNSDTEDELSQIENQEQFKLDDNKSQSSLQIYDTVIMEDNSCNAVDIPLNVHGDHLKISDCCNLIGDTKSNSIINLSFNGKIETIKQKKSEDNHHELNKQNGNSKPTRINISNSNVIISGTKTWQPQFSDATYTFTKSSNNYRKSPDLFADDDDDYDDNADDDDDDGDDNNSDNENGNEYENKNNVNDSGNDHSESAATKVSLSDLQATTSCDNMKTIISKDLHLGMKDSNNREPEYCNSNKTIQIDNDIVKESNNCDGFSLNNLIKKKHLFKKYRENCKTETLMRERIRKSLSGVLPPPSVTTPQLDMFTAVLSHKDAILNYLNNIQTSKNHPENETMPDSNRKNEHFIDSSLLKPTCTLAEAKSTGWPLVLTLKHHGLCYNLCKDSEINDYLSLSVIERFIGAETASSYVNPNLSSKPSKSIIRPKSVCQSPGNRLSHLARRRSIFSSANLANNSFKTQNLIGPQIILDKRKSKAQLFNGRSTPKRKTPSSSKKIRRKTPTSSARKRLFYNDITTKVTATITAATSTTVVAGPTVDTVKRAIFQSPSKDKVVKSSAIERTGISTSVSLPSSKLVKSDINERVEKSRRVLLFSPENITHTEGKSQGDAYSLNSSLLTKTKSHCPIFSHAVKRKRHEIGENETEAEDDEFSIIHASKLFKSYNETGLTPRALNIKSQSFCIGRSSISQTLTQTSQMLQQQHPVQKSQQHYYQQQQQSTSCNTKHSNVTSTNFLQSLQCNIVGSNTGKNSGNNNNNNNNTTTTTATTVNAAGKNTLQRALSDTIIKKNTLTENQKKKLLWAVSQALQDKKITVKHEKFKQYAAILARVVKRIFQEYYQKNCTSHSETMLRLAKRYVFQVLQDFTLDDIYTQAKQQIEDMKRPCNKRLMGYIAPEEYENLRQQQLQNQQHDWQANILLSLNKKQMIKQQQQQQQQETNSYDDLISSPKQLEMNTTATSVTSTSANTTNSIVKISTSTSISISDVMTDCSKERMEAKLSTKTTPNRLTNSSSKSNLNGSVLRENSTDSCVTRSAQKLFTGKDQRNKSPYATLSGGGGQTSSAIKVRNQLINNSNSRISDKVRRQIIFDC